MKSEKCSLCGKRVPAPSTVRSPHHEPYCMRYQEAPRERVKQNAGAGRQFIFHGAFKTKAAARRKERKISGAFIQPTVIRGQRRYLVSSSRNPARILPFHDLRKEEEDDDITEKEWREMKEKFLAFDQRLRKEEEGGKKKKNQPLPKALLAANPPIKVYERIKEIVAVKGPGHVCDAACKRAKHTYVHRFKTGAIYGNPDGSLTVK